MSDSLEPCPKCKGVVEWTNTRDLDILTSHIGCDTCGLDFFHVDTMAFTLLPNLDYETTTTKYNAWCKTEPKQYGEENWI